MLIDFIGFKLLYRHNHQLWSYCFDQHTRHSSVRYLIGHWVYPKSGCGSLTLFSDLEYIHLYVGGLGSHHFVDHCVYHCVYRSLYAEDICANILYNFGESFSDSFPSYCWPPGALACTLIKLLERVPWEAIL